MLSLADPVTVKYKNLDPQDYRAAVYVRDGKVQAGQSLLAAASGGHVDDQGARGTSIVSSDPRFNGIIVGGTGKYTIADSTFRLTGNGGNDFAGYGAAIMATDHADLTVRNVRIDNQGAIRTAVFVGGDAVVHVEDSDISVFNGALPADYQFNVDLGRMMEVPWMLGLSGNVRATNLVANGTVYYTRSHIRAQGWGALSTDDSVRVRMYVKDSTVETLESGYGAYSIGDSLDWFSHSKLRVADVGVIMAAQGSATFTDGTELDSGRFGVMVHSGGGGTLAVDKRSVVRSKQTAILVKGSGTNIVIDDARVEAGNGVLVQGMANDDPYMKKMMAGGGPPMGGGGPGGPGAGPGGPGGGPGSAATVGIDTGPKASPDIVATLRNATLEGDLLNGRTEQGDLLVKLEHARLTGAVSSSQIKPATGDELTAATRQWIGVVVNTLGPSPQAGRGTQVSVDATSRWTVARSSWLTKLAIARGGQLLAPRGARLELLVDGRPRKLAPGNFTGDIELRVTP